jgi:hypothetical protein
VIDTRRRAWIFSAENPTEREAEEAGKAAMALLIHVSNCDGLAILAERLPEKELRDLGDRLDESRRAGVPLLEWAEKIRRH